MSRRLPFIYLASQPYSGSTLLSILANAHPEIASVGEMTGLPGEINPFEYQCSCGTLITQCSFWRAVRDAMRDRGHDFEVTNFNLRFELGRTPWMRRLKTGSLRSDRLEHARDMIMNCNSGYSAGLHELGARNEAFAASVLEVRKKRVFFDASKYHMAIKYLRQYTDVDLKIVHLVRDVRGATASLMRHLPALGLRHALWRWIHGNRNIERQLAYVPASIQLRMRYEDLCSDTQGTLQKLFRFCGVDPDVKLAVPQESPGCIVGNYMRLNGISEIKCDDRWQRAFTAEQLRIIQQLAGDLNSKYGYRAIDRDVREMQAAAIA